MNNKMTLTNIGAWADIIHEEEANFLFEFAPEGAEHLMDVAFNENSCTFHCEVNRGTADMSVCIQKVLVFINQHAEKYE